MIFGGGPFLEVPGETIMTLFQSTTAGLDWRDVSWSLNQLMWMFLFNAVFGFGGCKCTVCN